MKYCLVPLGCQMNKSDSERVTSVLDNMGFVKTEKEEDANILGVVACSVRQKSINKVYGRIEKWNQWKNNKNLLTFVSGCILKADEEKFLKLFDFVFKINDLTRLPELITQYGITTPRSRDFGIPEESLDDYKKGFWKIDPTYSSSFQAYVPIQNGCNKFCTFCAVPYTRGREISRPSSEIIEEVRGLVENDYKSITILGQNVNSYGLDKKGEELNFAQLLEEIGKIGEQTGKKFWLYFTSPHPSDMNDKVFEVMSRYPCLANNVHLALQSGDDEVLQNMNRSYNIEDYAKIVESIRRILPESTLFTDIIVGFSGETEQQFENTKKAFHRFQFNMAYIAPYSPRPGAKSYKWEDDIEVKDKKRRHNELTDVLKEISIVHNEKMIGKKCEVLVEGTDRKEGYLAARTEGLIPARFACDDTSRIGTFVTIKITSATPFALSGELIV